ncbi:MAG: CHRD domain-containing protein [Betaproteobacteria bacterium]|nr:MAG: CHRD domain-containing protein [Betaproteobacteria bacterium]TMI00993.1 MAG: CHRD domain-containing protein [Betaproteobacteria bacterium]TMI08111.1 MAG: CHRD domain-containing protein [Betaproteobacteria bacterium]
MKKLAIITAVLAAFPALSASADDKIRARLMGFQEVPVVSTEASGTLEAVISPNGDAIDYDITYTGIQGTVTQSHMHVGQRSVNGGIVLWVCGTTGTPGPAGTPTCTSPNGHFSGTWMAGNVQTVATQQLGGDIGEVITAIRAGNAYMNVHSNLSPGGEIRGQIRANRRDRD